MAEGYFLPEPGDIVAEKFRIIEELGRGGFGAVFVAEQLGVGRQVALKTMLPQIAMHENLIERFKREAELIKNLNHPNTVRLYDLGSTGHGLFYIAMEMLKGKPLSDALEQGERFNTLRMFRIIEQVLKSLIEAHHTGIIHRDLKPENIMLVEMLGEEDFIKVLDFGIAKATGSGANEMKRLTATGQSFGTPSYMAPEVLLETEIGPWTDLYAVGLIMAEMITGEIAVMGDTPMVITIKQASATEHEFPPEITESGFGQVILKATKKDPKDRFQSAQEFLEAMRKTIAKISQEMVFSSSMPLMATSDSNSVQRPQTPNPKPDIHNTPIPPDPLPKTSSKSKVVLLISLVVLLAGTAVWYMATRQGNPKTETPQETKSAKADPNSQKQETLSKVDTLISVPTSALYGAAISEQMLLTSQKLAAISPMTKPEKIVAIEIISTPRGATVWSGNEKLGKTPYQLDSTDSAKPFEISLKLRGYQTQRLMIDSEQNLKYAIKLKKKTRKTQKDKQNKTKKTDKKTHAPVW